MNTDTGQESAREIDHNGYMTVRDNPITRAGVFQYKGSSLPDADPSRIYNVYRPLEELSNAETLKSFQGLPIIDEHEMLGDRYPRAPEERGVHGSVLESVVVRGLDILANIRIWSRTLKSLIDAGKTALSLGYNCRFEKSVGVFEGMPYDYIQRNIRGNHLALVTQGRSGTEVLDELDVFDHFDLALDTKELKMADEDKKDDKKDDKKSDANKDTPGGEKKDAIGVDDIHAWAKANMPKIKEFMALMAADDEEKDEQAMDGDTKEKPGDQAKDEKDDKACDKEDDKKEDKAMDAADITKIVDGKLSAFTKSGVKSIMGEVTKRDNLAKELTPLVGTFDHTAMDSDDVAKYGLEKLGLTAQPGHEKAVLDGYLAGLKKNASSQVGFAMDSAIAKPKADGKLAKRLNNAA